MPSKSKTRKSWREKLYTGEAKIVDVPIKWRKRYGHGRMLIAKPLDVDKLIRGVKNGELITQSQIRGKLAADAGVDHTCPLTTGIFIRIIAEYAEEQRREGGKNITPWWRVIKDNGNLNDKLPGGIDYQSTLLRSEGHKISYWKTKKYPRVLGFEEKLVEL